MTFYLQPYPHRHSMPRRWVRMAEDRTVRSLAANVHDEEDAFVLTALVPGLKAEDLTINILEDVVTIEGEFKQDEREYLMCELPVGNFRRSLRLPAAVNADKAEAKITDGVLTLHLPKAESARPKKIKIAAK
ncbi:MAG: Hsp20/alpha crystallin family protein [Chloroflexota bacterium]